MIYLYCTSTVTFMRERSLCRNRVCSFARVINRYLSINCIFLNHLVEIKTMCTGHAGRAGWLREAHVAICVARNPQAFHGNIDQSQAKTTMRATRKSGSTTCSPSAFGSTPLITRTNPLSSFRNSCRFYYRREFFFLLESISVRLGITSRSTSL